MKHVVFYSSGAGSWGAAKRVIDQYGPDDVVLLFTDTLMEDSDNYRFLVEGAEALINTGNDISGVLQRCNNLPPVTSDENMDTRKDELPEIKEKTEELIPNITWIIEGRSVWDVFFDTRFLGNTRADPCSRTLKRETAHEHIRENYEPEDTTLYVGIDWTEIHRMDSVWAAWEPFNVDAPLTEKPRHAKWQIMEQIKELGVEPPRLYAEGRGHANCSGACVKQGHGAWTKLLEHRPETFKYWEQKEQEIRVYLEKDVAILRDRRDGTTDPFTLTQLREKVEEEGKDQVDMFDRGGCGCFLDYEDSDD